MQKVQTICHFRKKSLLVCTAMIHNKLYPAHNWSSIYGSQNFSFSWRCIAGMSCSCSYSCSCIDGCSSKQKRIVDRSTSSNASTLVFKRSDTPRSTTQVSFFHHATYIGRLLRRPWLIQILPS